MTPYYADEAVTLWWGDCLEVPAWLDGDVLVTDPPYGIGWAQDLAGYTIRGYLRGAAPTNTGIVGDEDTTIRDTVLTTWGDRPALVFGSPRAPLPAGVKHVLTWRKPADSGLIGSALPWRRDTESVYVLGRWPASKETASSVLEGPAGMRSYIPAGSGYHPHTKPVSLMETLIAACPPGVIVDPFAGSGSTLMAAKRLGRRAVGVEIDEGWCEVAARRLAQGVLALG